MSHRGCLFVAQNRSKIEQRAPVPTGTTVEGSHYVANRPNAKILLQTVVPTAHIGATSGNAPLGDAI